MLGAKYAVKERFLEGADYYWVIMAEFIRFDDADAFADWCTAQGRHVGVTRA